MARKNKTPEELFEENRGLVHHISFRYKCPYEHLDDMLQEGYLTLWRCAQLYDDSKNIKFSTYAGSAIQRAYSNYCYVAWNKSGLSASRETVVKAYKAEHGIFEKREGYDNLAQSALSTEYLIGRYDDDGNTIGDRIPDEDLSMELQELRTDIDRALDELGDETKQLIVYHFGLDGEEPKTYAECGRLCGMSVERASQKVRLGLARLRHPRLSYRLIDYAERNLKET